MADGVRRGSARPPGTILSRSELEGHIYGWSEEIESNAVEFLIHAVRKKLGAMAIRKADFLQARETDPLALARAVRRSGKRIAFAPGAMVAFPERATAAEFLRQARRRGWTQKPRSARPRVAYFVDVFANYNDPTIAESVVAVLHHNGVEVYVPPGQLGCGVAPLAYGDVETARETVQHNLRLLADLARVGYPILCSEPTAALMFR